jgi:hypothetical protein
MEDDKEHLLPHQKTAFDKGDFDCLKDGSGDDMEDVTESPLITKARKEFRLLVTPLLVLVFITSFGGLVVYIKTKKPHAISLKESQWKHCGNTSAEALANNCILDFIPGAWVPRACYDAELEEEFLSLQQWQWYADKESQHELSLEFIRETGGPNPIFVSIEYHRQHCAYTWKKLHRAVVGQVPIDTHIGGYKHTIHCANALAASDPPVQARFFEIFTSCKMPQDCKSYLALNNENHC